MATRKLRRPGAATPNQRHPHRGGRVTTLMDFERLLGAGAVDFVQPSVAKIGGITELQKVLPIASAHNVTVMSHCFYDGPRFLAAIHTVAARTADAMIEWRYFDLEAQLYGGALAPAKSRISVPRGPWPGN